MRRRSAFTLVEMMVAMVLTVFIMVILSEAFKTGLETFRQLKAIGDMDQGLRTAATILRRDLSADHFEGKRRLSDLSFLDSRTENKGPPEMGYFRIVQRPAATAPISEDESRDADGNPSRRRTTHWMAFTVKLRGNRREDYFYARVPPNSPFQKLGQPDSRFQEPVAPGDPGTYACQWIEVAYFLAVPPGNPTADGTPLFALYRRQRLLVPDNEELNWGPTGVPFADLAKYSQISCMQHQKDPGRVYFNGPHDVTIPERRFGMNTTRLSKGLFADTTGAFTQHMPFQPLPHPESGARTGDDLLLANVLSFDIQVKTSATSPFVDFPTVVGLYDSWSRRQDDNYDYSTLAVPNMSEIHAVQITLRIWDARTKQSRQVTIVQDM
jgi:type II secretory pathway pseudopilin PulG